MEMEMIKLQRLVAAREVTGRAWGPQVWLSGTDALLMTGALAAALGVSFAGGWYLASRYRRRAWY